MYLILHSFLRQQIEGHIDGARKIRVNFRFSNKFNMI